MTWAEFVRAAQEAGITPEDEISYIDWDGAHDGISVTFHVRTDAPRSFSIEEPMAVWDTSSRASV